MTHDNILWISMEIYRQYVIVCCIQDGDSLLHLACKNGDKDVALMLIERGANLTDNYGVRVIVADE
jgi:ankyrin repeat protein